MRRLISCIAVCVSFVLHANNEDSLINTYDSLAKKYLFVQKDSARKYLNLYVSECQSRRNDRALILAYKLFGIWYDVQAQYDSSHQMYEKSLKLAMQTGNRETIADVRSNLGLLENKRGNYQQAVKELTNACAIYDSLGLRNKKGHALINITWTCISLDLYKKAQRAILESIELFEDTGDKNGLARAYANLAVIHARNNSLDSASLLYERASLLMEEIGNIRGLARMYNNQGTLCLRRNRPDKSIALFKKSLQAKREIGDQYGVQVAKKNIAEAYRMSGDYPSALEHLKAGYNALIEKPNPELLKEYYLEFSLLSEAMGNFNKSLDFHKKYATLNDSLRNIANAEVVAEIETKYQSEKKDREIELLAKTNEARLNQRNFFITITVALFILGVTVFFLLRITKQKNNELSEKNHIIKQALNEREVLLREIHHRVKNNLQIVSSLLNIQSKLLQDPSAKSAVQTGRDRVQSMALTHKLLYQNQDLSNLSLREYISQLSDSLVDTYGAYDDIVLQKDIDEILIDLDSAVNLGLLINELISNAMKHAFEDYEDATISIKLKQIDEKVELIVADNGKGFQENESRSSSYGMRLIKSLAEALSGSLSINSTNGTEVKLVMPGL